MYTPQHLQRWHELINYTGENFDDYWVAHWRFFRCSPTERANFQYIKEHLQDCGDPRVEYPTFTDAMMLLRYYILVHKDNERGLKMADMLAERVKRKHSLDPTLEQRMKDEHVRQRWAHNSTLAKRVEWCRSAGVSIFAARRPQVPDSEALAMILGDA